MVVETVRNLVSPRIGIARGRLAVRIDVPPVDRHGVDHHRLIAHGRVGREHRPGLDETGIGDQAFDPERLVVLQELGYRRVDENNVSLTSVRSESQHRALAAGPSPGQRLICSGDWRRACRARGRRRRDPGFRRGDGFMGATRGHGRDGRFRRDHWRRGEFDLLLPTRSAVACATPLERSAATGH